MVSSFGGGRDQQLLDQKMSVAVLKRHCFFPAPPARAGTADAFHRVLHAKLEQDTSPPPISNVLHGYTRFETRLVLF